MRLTKVQISGYRRFAGPAELRVLGPVTAIVGPNEAGKTTALRALEHLSLDRGFERRELHGRKVPPGNPTVVRASFAVDSSDLTHAGVAELFTSSDPVVLEVYKRAGDTEPQFELVPELFRDLTPRETMIQGLRNEEVIEALTLRTPVGDGSDEEIVDASLATRAADVAELLTNADEDLGDESDALTALATALEERAETGDGTAASALEQVRQLIEHEGTTNPHVRAQDALAQLVPRFLFFGESDRQIEDAYAWEDYPSAPAALSHLLHLADVDFEDYRSIATDPDRVDELAGLERRANERLAHQLSVWTQSDLTVTLRADAGHLRVFAFEPLVGRDTLVSERSAGLRTFIALVAFATRYGGRSSPVLLFDEAEQHLHYGAQADLVDVFQSQNMLANVIYTTHSIGCLPDDLGTTIRVIRREGDSERSTIENNFWASGAGITPLMLAMGASALAFTPARSALIGEGPTEAVLLPSLLKAAAGAAYRDPLGFQVAPGLAIAGEELAHQLDTDAGVVLYVVDDDEGGRAHTEKIDRVAHDEDRVLVLGGGESPGLCTEDLVAAALLVDAFNRVVAETRPEVTEHLLPSNLPDVARGAFLDQWCKERGVDPVGKPHVAYVALWLHLDDPDGRPLLEESRRSALMELREAIQTRLPVTDG
jgi:hypothetical protein